LIQYLKCGNYEYNSINGNKIKVNNVDFMLNNNIISNNTDWSYIIGNFKIANNSYGLVKLYSGDTISNKFISIQVSNNIYINGQSNLKIIQIEENSNIIPNNIKKCIKICEIFNHHQCKKCNVLLKELDTHCVQCKKNAVKIIESNWIKFNSKYTLY
jgi:hypothetical protein